MIRFVLYLFFIFFVSRSNAIFNDRVRVWDRIPQYYVDTRVHNFLNENRITNCYEFVESPTNLLLKCWRDNSLTDVSINIYPSQKKQKNYIVSLSI